MHFHQCNICGETFNDPCAVTDPKEQCIYSVFPIVHPWCHAVSQQREMEERE